MLREWDGRVGRSVGGGWGCGWGGRVGRVVLKYKPSLFSHIWKHTRSAAVFSTLLIVLDLHNHRVVDVIFQDTPALAAVLPGGREHMSV